MRHYSSPHESAAFALPWGSKTYPQLCPPRHRRRPPQKTKNTTATFFLTSHSTMSGLVDIARRCVSSFVQAVTGHVAAGATASDDGDGDNNGDGDGGALVAVSVEVGGVAQPMGSLPDGSRFVVAANGQPYSIVVRSLTNQPVCLQVVVDGRPIDRHFSVLPAAGATVRKDRFVTKNEVDRSRGLFTHHARLLQFDAVPVVAKRFAKKRVAGRCVVSSSAAIQRIGEIAVVVREAVPSHAVHPYRHPYRADLTPIALVEGSSAKVPQALD